MASTTSARSQGGLKLLGIEVRVQVSWLLVAVLIAWSLASGAFPQLYRGLPTASYWTMAALVVVGLATSIVLHELAHSLVARWFGLRVERITLFMFGAAAELHDEPRTPVSELLMALAGPALSLLLSLTLSQAAGALQAGGGRTEAVAALSYLATLNLVLAVFNLAPAFPMDGGRVLRAILWMLTGERDRSTRIAGRAGEAVAVALMMAGVFVVMLGQAVGLWWVLLGLFLRLSARTSLQDLEARRWLHGHPLSEVMLAEALETLPAQMTIGEFVERGLFTGQHGMYPIAAAGELVGVVEPGDILAAPKHQWDQVTLGEVCAPLDSAPTAPATEDAHETLDRMRRSNRSRLLVLDRDRLVGIVTLADLLERLQLAQLLERARGRAPARTA